MKYQTTPRFQKDWKALPLEHRRIFTSLVGAFSRACDEYLAAPGSYTWPQSLRVRPMTSLPGLWEMTWSFSGPDGRATFEFITLDGEPHVRWRRIGTHAIYTSP